MLKDKTMREIPPDMDRYREWLRSHPRLANFTEEQIEAQYRARCGFETFQQEERERVAEEMAEYIYRNFGVCLKVSVLKEALGEVVGL